MRWIQLGGGRCWLGLRAPGGAWFAVGGVFVPVVRGIQPPHGFQLTLIVLTCLKIVL